ncbi:serine/threonine-protein kinase Ste7p [[Candida] jaroonii]|uniref:Serine/threonine-protein kinase Ste7p n=1 Tax=[Candida] jaroonii TaxID=467808 RepID=A0ACA9Y8T9_9ASCO|nr:serine/threonine-protein kinase Ste7p [[Candida] jaroonii]
MMNLRNSSTSSLKSKDKELPPIPPPGTSNVDGPNDDEVLKIKSLKRKNFKKLSLNNDDDEIKEPLDDLKYETNSLRTKRNNLRPAPLVLNNQRLESRSNRSSMSSISSLNTINLSQRNIDPDSITSTDNIINQFSTLELNQNNKKEIIRKRQTVISSISPTKSNSNIPSPKDDIEGEFSPIFSTTSSMKFNNKDLVTLKSLGSGNSGSVSKILHVPTQKIMAKKVIPIDSKTIIQNQIIRELKILHECQSPYIIEFFGAFINNNNTIVICMEYINCGSLDKIQKILPSHKRSFPNFALKKLSFSILSGLVYLYENYKIIHRDIKPSNVLMNHKGQFKLCDFGVSRELTNSLAMADTFVGTSTYMSPERIQGLEYGIKSDVWSMGLMLIELSTGKSIWYDDNKKVSENGPEGILDLLQRIVNEDPPNLNNRTDPVTNEPYDEQLCKFINSCLIKNDKERQTPCDLLKHDYLSRVEEGEYDKDVKNWSKMIRQLFKDT